MPINTSNKQARRQQLHDWNQAIEEAEPEDELKRDTMDNLKNALAPVNKRDIIRKIALEN